MRVLICGDRNYTNYLRILSYVKSLPSDSAIIEGEANGADRMARQAGEECGLTVEGYPADWKKYRRAAGPIRNKQMLDEGKPDLVVAFHDDIEHSKGTKDMMEQARKAGVIVMLNPVPAEHK